MKEKLVQWLVTYGNYYKTDLVGLDVDALIALFDEEGTGENAHDYFS
jgi:hypothetical protein